MKAVLLSILLVLTLQSVQSFHYDQCCEELPHRNETFTYTYYQDSGRLVGGKGKYHVDTFGYSGRAEFRNDPEYQCVPNTGALPATTYDIGKCKNYMHQPPKLRPCSFPLIPRNESEMCGRFAMLIHGCKVTTVGDLTTPPAAGCSEGCVIINLENRIKFREGDVLIVEHHDPEGTNDDKVVQ